MALTQIVRNNITAEGKDLIAEFLRSKAVTHVQPAGVPGNEASRATKELIAHRRREYRKANKA